MTVQMCAACGNPMSLDCGHRKNAIDMRERIPCTPVITRDTVDRRELAIVKLCDFYFEPWGAGKAAKWEAVTSPLSDRKFGDDRFTMMLGRLCDKGYKPEIRSQLINRILEVL